MMERLEGQSSLTPRKRIDCCELLGRLQDPESSRNRVIGKLILSRRGEQVFI
ncbi:hypothetical protein BGX38DRAFT_1224792 [Terfezia claveryi]|nr:hypothetical protein BGX38DRAFT_1224792 [Terfezia claveryi]